MRGYNRFYYFDIIYYYNVGDDDDSYVYHYTYHYYCNVERCCKAHANRSVYYYYYYMRRRIATTCRPASSPYPYDSKMCLRVCVRIRWFFFYAHARFWCHTIVVTDAEWFVYRDSAGNVTLKYISMRIPVRRLIIQYSKVWKPLYLKIIYVFRHSMRIDDKNNHAVYLHFYNHSQYRFIEHVWRKSQQNDIKINHNNICFCCRLCHVRRTLRVEPRENQIEKNIILYYIT